MGASRGIRTPVITAAGTSTGHRDKPAHLTRVVNCTVSDVKRPSQTLFGKVQGLFILGWGEKYSFPLAMG